MRRAHSLVLLALSMVACTGPAPAEWQASRTPSTATRAAATSGHQLVLRKQVVVDQQGLGYEVFRMLVPKDWSFSGGIQWTYNKFPPEAKTAYTVTSPEGSAVIERFPAPNMFWSTAPMMQQSMAQSGFTIMQPMEAAAFLKNLYLPQYRPDASGVKVLDSQPLPELARRSLEINQFMMNVFAQISPFQFPFEQRADSAHVTFEYMQGERW